MLRARELFPGNVESTALLVYSLAKAGRLKEAREVREQLLNMSATEYVAPYNLAMIHNGLGETGKALDCLEEGFAEKNVLMVFLKVDGKWDNLRREPRFWELIRKMNLF